MYQEKVSFDNKVWYQIEWDKIDFHTLDYTKEIKNCKNIDELEDVFNRLFPNSDFKSTVLR